MGIKMANLSNFPESIDSFIRHDDIDSYDSDKLNTYKELKEKKTLTSTQHELLQSILTSFRNKIWLAEDLNKIQDAIVNLQLFFIENVKSYISVLFNQYDVRISSAIGKIQDKKTEIDSINTNVTAWIDKTKSEVYNSQYFNFDNYEYMSGYKTEIIKENENLTIERIVNTSDGSVFATRTNSKDKDGNWTTRTVCSNVYPPIDVTEYAMNNGNGNWNIVIN